MKILKYLWAFSFNVEFNSTRLIRVDIRSATIMIRIYGQLPSTFTIRIEVVKYNVHLDITRVTIPGLERDREASCGPRCAADSPA
jgi:hypothetical protein